MAIAIIRIEGPIGDRPFGNLGDCISQEELRALPDHYKRIAGYRIEDLATAPAPTDRESGFVGRQRPGVTGGSGSSCRLPSCPRVRRLNPRAPRRT